MFDSWYNQHSLQDKTGMTNHTVLHVVLYSTGIWILTFWEFKRKKDISYQSVEKIKTFGIFFNDYTSLKFQELVSIA